MGEIEGVIGSLFYGLTSIILHLLDWLQTIFRSLAGLGPIKIAGEVINADDSEVRYDIVYYLLGTDIVIDIFVSMLAFSLVLLVITTVISLIRNSYADKPKAISGIIGNAFKGLLGFLLVPIACIAGLMFGNVLLDFVDSATAGGNATQMSGTIFLSSSYNANKLRQDNVKDCREALWILIDETNFEEYDGVKKYLPADISRKVSMNNVVPEDFPILADLLDDAFTGGHIKRTDNGKVLTCYNGAQVMYGYKLLSINYLVLVVGGIMLLFVFFKMSWGLIGRLFKLVLDFVLIPVVLAMMPYDEGSAVKSWKGDFVKNVLLAYGTVGVLNLYYSILPLLDNIALTNTAINNGFFNFIFKLMLQIIGLFSAEGLIKTISGWFGTGDLVSEGANTWKTVKDGYKKITDQATGNTKKVVGAFGGIVGGAKAGSGFGKVTSAFGGALSGAGLTKGLENVNVRKMWTDGTKAGKGVATDGLFGSYDDEVTNRRKAGKAVMDKYGAFIDERKVLGVTDEDDQKKDYAESQSFNEIASNLNEEVSIGSQTMKISEAQQLLKDKKEKQQKAKSNQKILRSLQDNLDTMENMKSYQGMADDAFESALTNFKKYGALDESVYSGWDQMTEEKRKEKLSQFERYVQAEDSITANAEDIATITTKSGITLNVNGQDLTKDNIDQFSPEDITKAIETQIKSAQNDKGKDVFEIVDGKVSKLSKEINTIQATNKKVSDAVFDTLNAVKNHAELTSDQKALLKKVQASVAKGMGKEKQG